MFAMRLMHLGISTYVIGESVTPSIDKRDLVIFISKSGETSGLINMADKLTNVINNNKLMLLTSNENSKLSHLSNLQIIIPEKIILSNLNTAVFPMGTLFESLALIILDAIIYELMNQMNINENIMIKNHFNLE